MERRAPLENLFVEFRDWIPLISLILTFISDHSSARRFPLPSPTTIYRAVMGKLKVLSFVITLYPFMFTFSGPDTRGISSPPMLEVSGELLFRSLPPIEVSSVPSCQLHGPFHPESGPDSCSEKASPLPFTLLQGSLFFISRA